jgi:hypothetical protein
VVGLEFGLELGACWAKAATLRTARLLTRAAVCRESFMGMME